MRIHVEVTAEDIAKGNPSHCLHCPIALALARAVPGSMPFVSDFGFSLAGCYGMMHLVPQIAKDFIRRFDNECYVEPIAFDLEVPDGPLTERV